MPPAGQARAEIWSPAALSVKARIVSASRRTDIPALYGEWFQSRLDAGFAEYVPMGPPRRIRASLDPQDVLAFVFWSKWPGPFLPVLERVLARRFPCLLHLTVTGLGGSPLEPGVPPPERVLRELPAWSGLLPRGALIWRFDPVFLSALHPASSALARFDALAPSIAPHVTRVVFSFVTPYARQVRPDLSRYAAEFGDSTVEASLSEKTDILGRLGERARSWGLTPLACCEAEAGLAAAGCASFGLLQPCWPDLSAVPAPRARPGRAGCTCVAEVDIGVYDTCTHGCRYCYASGSRARALQVAARHDPRQPCLLPPGDAR